jgi:hypothetical protein
MPEKIGDILIDQSGATECRALLRSSDGSAEVQLCAMHRAVYEDHSSVRELFVKLAGTVALNLDRPSGMTLAVRSLPPVQPTETKIDRSQFTCWQCANAQAAAARQCLSSYSDTDLQLSPRGNPIFAAKSQRRARSAISNAND